jgi:hypothetical protein
MKFCVCMYIYIYIYVCVCKDGWMEGWMHSERVELHFLSADTHTRTDKQTHKHTYKHTYHNLPAHLSHSVGCMKSNLQGLTWFECCEFSKEDLLHDLWSLNNLKGILCNFILFNGR